MFLLNNLQLYYESHILCLVLHYLDSEIVRDDVTNTNDSMSQWLREQLEFSGVLSIIEPYWTSLYKQTEASAIKSPPFFTESKSYYHWLADWGRYMMERSSNNSRSVYRKIFYSTRSALRSDAGLGIVEFLLPYLILDSICFGDDLDKQYTSNELTSVLMTFTKCRMPKLELQKSISTVFFIMKLFQIWSENEIEERTKAQRTERDLNTVIQYENSNVDLWSAEESILSIKDLLDSISLSACSEAAEFVGMFAQAIHFLEVDSRKKETQYLYDNPSQLDISNESAAITSTVNWNPSVTHIKDMNLNRAHRLFSELEDLNSMAAIAKCRTETNLLSQIEEKKSYEDWDSVLKLCELASQLKLEIGALKMNNIYQLQVRAMLELGQLESALHFAHSVSDASLKVIQNPIVDKNVHKNLLSPFMVESSWRLGRWELLQNLVEQVNGDNIQKLSKTMDLESRYNLHLGRAILCLQKRDQISLAESLRYARESIIPSLSVVASENYPRAIPYLLKLQNLQVIEDASNMLFNGEDSTINPSNNIKLKSLLTSIAPQNIVSMDTFNIRLALSSITSDYQMQSSLWLKAGRFLRKQGLFHLAESALTHAEAVYQKCLHDYNDNKDSLDLDALNYIVSEINLQMAKVVYAKGQTTEAIKMLSSQEFDKLLVMDDHSQVKEVSSKLYEIQKLQEIGRTSLQATQWMVESGLKSGSDAISRYKTLTIILPDWEPGSFKHAHNRFMNYF